MRIASALLAGLLSLAVQAAPSPQVSLDRSLWPEQLDSPALFDVASRAEILSFAQALHESELLDDASLAARLGLRQINLQKVRQIRARMWQRLWEGYQQAQRSCEQDASFCYPVTSMAELRTQAATFAADVGAFYTGWIEPSHQFHVRYLDEQLRKAALLPQTSSEIERLSSRERKGDELNDRMFLLTFVGGPGPEGAVRIYSPITCVSKSSKARSSRLVTACSNAVMVPRQTPCASSMTGSAWVSRGGSTAPMRSGPTGRIRCGAARRGCRLIYPSSMCRCSVHLMASAGLTARRSWPASSCGYRCGTSMPRMTVH